MSNSGGFTLVEMVITVAVAALLLSVAVPSYRGLMQSSRITAQTNDIVSALHLARSEAVKRGVAVTLCPTTDGSTCAGATDWTSGWLAFTDHSGTAGQLDGSDHTLRSWGALSGEATLTGSVSFVRFQPLGVLASPVNLTLSIPDGGSSGAARTICVSRPGRPYVVHSGGCE